MEGEVVTTQDLFTYEFKGETHDGKLRRHLQELRPAPALPAARRLLRPRQGADGGDGMSGCRPRPRHGDRSFIAIGAGLDLPRPLRRVRRLLRRAAPARPAGGHRDARADRLALAADGDAAARRAAGPAADARQAAVALVPQRQHDPPEAAGVGHEHDAGRLRLHLASSLAVAVAFVLYLRARPGARHGARRLAADRHRPAQLVGRLARQAARPEVQSAVPRGGRPDRARAARRPAGAGGDRQRGARHQGPGRRRSSGASSRRCSSARRSRPRCGAPPRPCRPTSSTS